MTKILWEYVQVLKERILATQVITYNPHYSIGLYDYVTISEKLLVAKQFPKAGL